eukprot:1150459-Amphidinium_carterae.1
MSKMVSSKVLGSFFETFLAEQCDLQFFTSNASFTLGLGRGWGRSSVSKKCQLSDVIDTYSYQIEVDMDKRRPERVKPEKHGGR